MLLLLVSCCTAVWAKEEKSAFNPEGLLKQALEYRWGPIPSMDSTLQACNGQWLRQQWLRRLCCCPLFQPLHLHVLFCAPGTSPVPQRASRR